MRHVKETGRAVWYMANAGLLYGTLLGGLLSVAFLLFAIFIGVSTRGVAALIREISEQFIVWVRVVLVGAALGGGVGVTVGAIDGPILVLLMRVHLPHNQIIGGRSFIQGVNALLTGIGTYIAFMLLFAHSDPSALCFLVIVGCIASGAAWYSAGKFVDKMTLANDAS